MGSTANEDRPGFSREHRGKFGIMKDLNLPEKGDIVKQKRPDVSGHFFVWERYLNRSLKKATVFWNASAAAC